MNQLTGAAFIGTVGLDWQFAGIAPIHAAGASDLVLRNVNAFRIIFSSAASVTLLKHLEKFCAPAVVS